MKKALLVVLVAVISIICVFLLSDGHVSSSASPNGEYVVKYKVEEGWRKKPTVCKIEAKKKDDSLCRQNEVWTSRAEMMDVQITWITDSQCKLDLLLTTF